ncbi:MAG: hypothetical protein Q9160_001360 [Pyrenula sp. 1 TL-2023]
MAMMPSASGGGSYPGYNEPTVEDDLIEPDEGNLEYAATGTKAHNVTPLTGNIQSSQNPISQNYLTSSIPGEDRRAPQNTIDESVWDTLSRDLLAVWEKMKQVLWPKYLLGGMMQRGGGIGAAERGEATGFGGGVRDFMGRWPDAEVVLQGGMSEGLRDWDLWCGFHPILATISNKISGDL